MSYYWLINELLLKYFKKQKKDILQKSCWVLFQKQRASYSVQKKKALRNKLVLFLLSIRMGEKTLKCDNIKVNKKESHKSKQPINLDLTNVDQVVVSDKFKHSHDGLK